METANATAPVSATSAPMGSPDVAPKPTPAPAVQTKEAPTKAPQTPVEPKKFIFKGLKDGEDAFDFEGTEEDVKAMIQRAKAADKRFQEAAKERRKLTETWEHTQAELKKVESLKKLMAEDPIKAAEQLGIDPKLVNQAFEQKLLKQIQREQATEEQRALMEANERAELAERKLKETEEAKLAYENQQRLTQNRELIQNLIVRELQNSGLPKDEFMVKRMAQALKTSVARGMKLDPGYARQLVIENMQSDINGLLGGYTKDLISFHKSGDKQGQVRVLNSLENLIGQDTIKAIVKAFGIRFQSTQPNMPGNAFSKPIETAPERTDEPPKAYKFDTVEEEREYYKKRALDLQNEWEIRRQTSQAL